MLQYLVTAIAAGASLTAVLLGIDQLTSGAQLRNLESILRAARDVHDGTSRDDVVASLHRTSLARLIAREAVPARVFLVPSVMLASAVVVLVNVAVAPAASQQTVWVTVVASGVLFGNGLLQILNLIRERIRIRRWYEQGLTPLRAFTDILARMEGGTLEAILLASADGLLGAVSLYGLLRAFRGGPNSTLAAAGIALLILVFVGQRTISFVTRNQTEEPSNRKSDLEPTWVHPSAPAPPSGPVKSSGSGPSAPASSAVRQKQRRAGRTATAHK